jgi:hypothetical protein
MNVRPLCANTLSIAYQVCRITEDEVKTIKTTTSPAASTGLTRESDVLIYVWWVENLCQASCRSASSVWTARVEPADTAGIELAEKSGLADTASSTWIVWVRFSSLKLGLKLFNCIVQLVWVTICQIKRMLQELGGVLKMVG